MSTVIGSSHRTHARMVIAASLLTATATLLGGCSSASKSSPAMSAGASSENTQVSLASLGEYAAGEHLSLVRGQKFAISLPTHIGSHYNWRLSPESAASKNITLLERKSQQVERGESDLLDSRSHDVFTFRANRTGECDIQFIYDRPFVPEEAASREFAMSVDVSKVTKDSKPQVAQVASVTVE